MRKKPLALSILVAGAGILGAAAPSLTTAQTFSLEEVVVTARKKEETLQDVPVSVSNFSADDLAALNLTDTNDLSAFSPSVFIEPAPANNGTVAKTTIRGQVQSDNLITTDTSVGWYYDDVYLARSYGTINSLFDAERVEILKGPQGTLYGRNTTGGAIKIVTTKADPMAELNGFVNAGVGSFGAQKVGGAINLPLIENVLAVRLTALQDDIDDGFGSQTIVSNNLPGLPDFGNPTVKRDAGVKDAEMYRLGATWFASDDLTLNMSYEESEMYVTNLLYNVSAQRAAAATAGRSFDIYDDGASNMMSESWADTSTLSFTASYDINDDLSTKLVYGWRDVESKFFSDVDGSTAPINYFMSAFVQEAEQESVEWQLTGTAMDGGLEWITGIYWFTEKGIDNSNSGGIGGYLGGVRSGTFNATVDNNESRSAFFSGTLHLTETLNFTGGLRYTKDTKPVIVEGIQYRTNGTTQCRFEATGANAAPNANTTNCTWENDGTYEFISWQLGFDWFVTDNVLTYIKSSSASRSGGQNLRGRGGDTTVPFDEETATDIELGMKGEFFDNSLQLNTAYYHVFYDDVQQSQLLTNQGPNGTETITFINNATGADFDGIEVEAKWIVTDQLMVTGTLGWIDWAFDQGKDYARAVPEEEYTLRVNYLIPASYGTWNLDANYSYRGEYYPNSSATLAQTLASPQGTIDDVSLVGARATLDLEEYGVTLALWGRNLTDEEYTTSPLVLSYPAGLTTDTVAPPRSYGIEGTYRF
jgi:iron complex outermembrane receptor protein